MMPALRGCVTLVFDDGYTDVYNQVVPLLDQFGLPGVFAIPLDHSHIEQTEGYTVTPWPAWLNVRQRGHEIAAHSVTHADLTQLAPAQLDDELRRSQLGEIGVRNGVG
ncbi:MAG: polysaccharide deacetylase family protein, partial [Candidatus Andersenbacteria bacterium]|nr:polysaccharide deacetylase family protein [Candidatus Andersenbacteria bacterium]